MTRDDLNRMERLSPGTRMSGGEAIARTLLANGVGPIFGMAGFQLLPLYDAVRKIGLPHILINDERSGMFAADAYARATGRIGVCDATLGPGATNLVTGLVESLNAGIPVLAITGDANRQHAGKNMTQEGAQLEILRPACKSVLRVEDIQRIPEIVQRGIDIARSGRPGPVVVDVPEDVCHAEALIPSHAFARSQVREGPRMRSRPDATAVAEAVRLIERSRRPVTLVGGGLHLSRAYEELKEFAEVSAIPVAHTISGKGAIACTHNLSAGLFGRYSRFANELIMSSDCAIVIGSKLGEIATNRYSLFNGKIPVIQLDCVAEEIGSTTRVDVALVGDAALGLQDLTEAFRTSTTEWHAKRSSYLQEVHTMREAWREEALASLTSDEQPIAMSRLVHELNSVLPELSTVVTDGGFATHWTALLLDTKSAGRRYIADRGFASIGYALPACLGAWLAGSDFPVIGITGDGGLNMSLGELETAVRVGADITVIVVNNAASGYVKALQHAMFNGRYQSSDLSEIDYARVAEAYGAQGIRVEHPDELAAAITTGIETRGRPTIVDVVVTRDPARMLPGIDSRTSG